MTIELTWSAVDRGFELLSGKTKHYTIGICSISTKGTEVRSRVRSSSGWPGIRIMCPSGVTYLPAYYCFGELALGSLPWYIGDLSRFWRLILGPLLFLLSKFSRSIGFPNWRLWAYMMKSIPETCCVLNLISMVFFTRKIQLIVLV